jgi:hypothetical protein
MTEEQIREIEKDLQSEDFFDDLMHPYDVILELLAEVKRLHHLE